MNPEFQITARTVIHRLNFRHWDKIIQAAKSLHLDQISFLPADTTSHAFNREVLWTEKKQHEVLPDQNDLPELKNVVNQIINTFKKKGNTHFIAENEEKLHNIFEYYAASYGLKPFPYKKCNAPWVSAVVEPDGTVRPCFFHDPVGNIRNHSLSEIVNNEKSKTFRRKLDMETNMTCVRCVCSLNLPPGTSVE